MILFFAFASFPVFGQHPLKEDTDGDGIPDGWENKYGLDPLDANDANMDYNYDGLTNLQEYERGLDPWDEDTDDDGISNYAEYRGLFGFFTDPLVADTDGDGLSDLQEICEEIPYKLDPTDPDSDHDGLNDGDELSIGTNPNRVDSDFDGLSDGDEVHIYGTSPTERDTDGDGLLDSEEVFGAYGAVTDPTKEDTDGDGISDGEECLGFGLVPIPPSKHALTYEEFISSNIYASSDNFTEYVTIKARVAKIMHDGGLSNYSILLKPLRLSNMMRRGVVRVESSWYYDFEHDMMLVDKRFGFTLREGDTIVVVGRAGRIRGITREITVDSEGKIYLILSPEEAKRRWLPSKDYVKIMPDKERFVEASPSPSPPPSPTPPPSPPPPSPSPMPSPSSAPLPSPLNETNNNATEIEKEVKTMFGLLSSMLVIMIISMITIIALFFVKYGRSMNRKRVVKKDERNRQRVIRGNVEYAKRFSSKRRL
ncbi:MAG: binary toxin-like calcium binding domain-containing protein [Candidatus Methanospirareceae archaeon]